MKPVRDAAQKAQGLHFESPEARGILDDPDLDWSGVWPVVDASGLLTGEISEGEGDEKNVGDMAMIGRADLRRAGLHSHDGYAIGIPHYHQGEERTP